MKTKMTLRIPGVSGILAVFVLAAGLLPAQMTAVDDDFDDNDLTVNTNGTGSGWNAGSFNGGETPQETDGAFVGAMSTEQGISAIQGKDIFPVWNADGTEVTWTIRSMTVNTPHKYNMYYAYMWEMGLLSSDNSNAGTAWNMAAVNKEGGFYIFIGKKDNSNAVRMWFCASNKVYTGTEGDPGCIWLDGPLWTATFPLSVTLAVTDSGWQVSTNQAGLAPVTGNWTTSLQETDNDASLTDEFADGVFIWTAARNFGIDGTGDTYTANTGSMERITVVRNPGAAVFDPAISPDGGTFDAPVEVTLSCATAGATIRYTTDGSDPSGASPLYSAPFTLSSSGTVKARAYKDGMTDSPVSSALFLIVPDTCTAVVATWYNEAIPAQEDTFTAYFTVTPAITPLDGIVCLSRGPVFDYGQTSVGIRFTAGGVIDARNGTAYAADQVVSYTAGTAYHFRVAVDVPADQYSVYVTPEGGSEVLLAAGYAFRTVATRLVMWNSFASSGNLLVCGVRVGPESGITNRLPRDVRSVPEPGAIYDLNGRTADGSVRGIYIIRTNRRLLKTVVTE